MMNFIYPTRFKILLAVALIVYVYGSIYYLTVFTCARCKEVPALNTLDKVGIAIALPTNLLIRPAIFVSHNIFTKDKTAREFLRESGLVNADELTNPTLDKPIKTATPLGTVIGTVAEIVFLYFLACLIMLVWTRKSERVKKAAH